MTPKLSHVLATLLLLVILPFAAQSRTLKSAAGSSNVLENLEGSYKGQTVKGLQLLKRYLIAYGYLDYNNDPENTNLSDDFDEFLESSLKTYQKNYNLKVTGIFDSDTIKEMQIKRCGNPDIINHNTSSSTNSGEFHTVGHYQFFQGTPRWPSDKTNLLYSFRSSEEVVSLEELRPIIKSAFQRWADVSQFTFEEATDEKQADIVIGFHRLDHGDDNPFDGPGTTLAHAFSPPDGRFHFDADEKWSSNPSTGEEDLETVAVHEIGHLLGLQHSKNKNAVMFSEIPAESVKRELAQDDIDGVRALYSN
ncbi:metalloendoproteinase 2-MMP-like [Melia azedarach]|uniref:Metalloendoproteinase 2-MMP-like n=1 Tax=Melia azedarach TaxID=155640 RepID=A0ACC1YZU6_MELAZ|nr:metalloendoproteinase 2-MMP-like [Melia azedarach]